jgi:hypothetical protein
LETQESAANYLYRELQSGWRVNALRGCHGGRRAGIAREAESTGFRQACREGLPHDERKDFAIEVSHRDAHRARPVRFGQGLQPPSVYPNWIVGYHRLFGSFRIPVKESGG